MRSAYQIFLPSEYPVNGFYPELQDQKKSTALQIKADLFLIRFSSKSRFEWVNP